MINKFIITAQESPKTESSTTRKNTYYLTLKDGVWYEVVKYFRGNYSVKMLEDRKVTPSQKNKFKTDAMIYKKVNRVFERHLSKRAKLETGKQGIAECMVNNLAGFEHGIEYLIVNDNYSTSQFVALDMYGKNQVVLKNCFKTVKEIA